LTRSLTTARAHWSPGEKCAAGAGRTALGLRPRSVRPAPAHSHPDWRCCLTLIVARQGDKPQRRACTWMRSRMRP